MLKFLGKNKSASTILYRISSNENMKDIAKKYNINLEILKQNPTKELYAGQCIILDGMNKTYHVVKPTESIAAIAKLYGKTPQEILEINHTKQIFIGQMLEIPNVDID